MRHSQLPLQLVGFSQDVLEILSICIRAEHKNAKQLSHNSDLIDCLFETLTTSLAKHMNQATFPRSRR
jgi:hypothetical protein